MSRLRRKILLHSDDIGMTPAVTDRIGAAWSAGLLDGFSVLANGTGLERLTALLAAEPERPVRIAVHLDLREGPSVVDPSRIPLLVDAEGNLASEFSDLAARWLTHGTSWRSALVGQVELEWRAQIERVLAVCAPRRPSAVDGHTHVHMLPFLFPIAARLAREYGIPEIRISRESLHLCTPSDVVRPSFLVNLLKLVVLRVCSRMAEPVARREGLAGPGALVGILYSGRMTAAAARAGCAAALDAARIEVLFHIGRAHPGEGGTRHTATSAFQYSPARDAEHAELARFLRTIEATDVPS
ncbi:MAG: ChbG/HpnK family deacetylase [Myxococcota bacterium]